jgi:hypothetical protein
MPLMKHGYRRAALLKPPPPSHGHCLRRGAKAPTSVVQASQKGARIRTKIRNYRRLHAILIIDPF